MCWLTCLSGLELFHSRGHKNKIENFGFYIRNIVTRTQRQRNFKNFTMGIVDFCLINMYAYVCMYAGSRCGELCVGDNANLFIYRF